MRFDLEPGDTLCDGESKSVTIKINHKERINLPSTSYAFVNDSFVVLNFGYNPIRSTATSLSSGLQLKLEKIGNDYKLALVTGLSEHYYYYYGNNKNTTIATIDCILKNQLNGQDVYIYDHERCSARSELLGNSKVLIDPKDIISNKNISLILENLKNSPDKRLKIEPGDSISYLQRFYRSVKIYDLSDSEIGILNNVVPIFNKNGSLGLLSFHKTKSFINSYFIIEKLDNDYVACIPNKSGKYRSFYDLAPKFKGDHYYDVNSHLCFYRYNLENLCEFFDKLEVDMVNLKEFLDLGERVKHLENMVENLRLDVEEAIGMSRSPGLPGQKGDRGEPGRLCCIARILERGKAF